MGETSTGDTARLGCENPAQGGSIAQRGSGLVGDETSTGDAAALGARTAQKEDAPNGEFTEKQLGFRGVQSLPGRLILRLQYSDTPSNAARTPAQRIS